MMYNYVPDRASYKRRSPGALLRWLLLCAILSLGFVSTEAFAQGNVQGIKFNDVNGNGVYDFGENPLANWVICAYNPATGTLVTTLTNTAGQYFFTGLSAGTWLIYEDQLAGWTQTTPGSVFYTEIVVSGMTTIGRDFGNAWICSNPLATTIPAGLQDNFLMPTEPASASPDLRAFLTTNFTWPVREFFDYGGTNHSFGHSFTNLLGDNNGCYIVSARLEIRLRALGSGNPMDDMIGFVQGGQAVWSSSISALYGAPWSPGAQNTFILDLDNLPASASGITNILAALRDGTLDVFVQNNTSVDYMILQLEYCCDSGGGAGGGPTLEGTKYNDLNGNGVRDPGEPGLAGWVISAYHNPSGQTVSATTDASGNYTLYLPISGEWVVYENQQPGWTQTAPAEVVHVVAPDSPPIVTGLDFGNIVVCPDPSTSSVTVGVDDDFDTGNGNEYTSPSTAFATYMHRAYKPGSTNLLDGSGLDKSIGHTFTGFLPPGCIVTGARLTLKIRANGNGSGNDLIAICADEVNAWAGFITDIVGYPWTTGSVNVITLDLANLPGTKVTNVLGALQDGDFDFFMQDDTGLDYATLEVDYCCNIGGGTGGATDTLQGIKYHDINGNGVKDPGEPGLAGWVISAYQNPTGQTTSATTDASGNYTLYLPITGEWIVYENQQPGWTQTAPAQVVHVVTTASGSLVTGLDFGNIEVCSNPATSSVSVGVDDDFNPSNGNEYTSPSTGLYGYMNAAYTNGNTNLLDDTGTDRVIGHTFTGFLPPGCIVTGARLTIKIRANGGGSNNDLIALVADEVNVWAGFITDIVGYSWATGSVDIITLDLANLPGTNVTNVLGALQDGDFDFFMQDDTGIDYATLEVDYCCNGNSIEGMKFYDSNHNGVNDPGEAGLPSWMIEAFNPATGQVFNATTDASGHYLFPTLAPGTWLVYEVQQPGWTQTYPPSVFHTVTVIAGLNVIGVDFGNTANCTMPSSMTYINGVIDNFTGGVKASNPDPALMSFLGTLGGPVVAYYDLPPSVPSHAFGATIGNLVPTGCYITGAHLTIHMATAASSGSIDDVLGFVQNGQEIWRQNISFLAGMPWVSTQTVLTLDLSALPIPLNGSNITNILASLQDGTLDIFVHNNTRVDYIEVTVEYCCPPMKVTSVGESMESNHSPTYAVPNPFGESTDLTFTLPAAAPVQIVVYDIYGNTVRTFDLGERTNGTHSVRWDGRDISGMPVANGLYLYQVETSGLRYTGKVLLQR